MEIYIICVVLCLPVILDLLHYGRLGSLYGAHAGERIAALQVKSRGKQTVERMLTNRLLKRCRLAVLLMKKLGMVADGGQLRQTSSGVEFSKSDFTAIIQGEVFLDIVNSEQGRLSSTLAETGTGWTVDRRSLQYLRLVGVSFIGVGRSQFHWSW
eukprot:GHVS01051178.1.p1 GENE.GHVS01051178.1~~GHVS01051178.1.p1  ORF type:complete len:155 (-),score=18.93 GHVS01051178.1:352-816(-)